MDMIHRNPIIEYFGIASVEQAIESYFYKYGVNEKTRDDLIEMELKNPKDFLELVCDFIENK